ncbi:MAG: hypothetical protein GY816_01705 [Cytophagales bacterium]|nr:hypothetical protein [Cytophagales bacterium]
MTKKKEAYVSRYGIDASAIPDFPKMHWASGFDFPDLPVITNTAPDRIQRISTVLGVL